jgi:hypothetical protein
MVGPVGRPGSEESGEMGRGLRDRDEAPRYKESVKGMLDAFIIEEIKRRERARQERDRDRPAIELPLPPAEEPPRRRSDEEEEKPPRGVVIIDLSV